MRRQPNEPGTRHGERGAAVVEFALIVPVLLMLVMGLLTGGLVYNHKLDLVSAAREGARYGAALPQDSCTPITKCIDSTHPSGQTWAELVQSVVVSRSDGDVTTAQVCVAFVSGAAATVIGSPSQSSFSQHGAASATARCFDDGGHDTTNRIQVQITRSGDEINAALFTIPVTLTSSAVAKSES
jgi:Flp pilus assembly protein TadG